jgi:hypothetical protein
LLAPSCAALDPSIYRRIRGDPFRLALAVLRLRVAIRVAVPAAGGHSLRLLLPPIRLLPPSIYRRIRGDPFRLALARASVPALDRSLCGMVLFF